MGEGNGIINIDLGGIGEAASKLIEKVSDGIGGAFLPKQIVRTAKAQAEADLIGAKSRIEISDLHRRSIARAEVEECRHQENIERITRRAIPLLSQDAKPEQVDTDWIANFFAKSRIVSDAEMQSLWAGLLASEANAPGTISKRAVNILADLDKTDAETFSTLCNFCWKIETIDTLIFDLQDEIVVKNGLKYEVLAHLESLGLITIAQISSYVFNEIDENFHTANYFGRVLRLKIEGPTFPGGKVMLTASGKQLAKVAMTGPIEGVFEYVRDHLSDQSLLLQVDSDS